MPPGATDPIPPRRRVLITGAAGRIGSHLAAALRERYELTLMVRPGEDASVLAGCGEVAEADLGDLPRLKTLMAGIDTVVHLAADPRPEATWDELLAPNIVGAYHAFAAAVAARVRRVIFASSIHAVSGHAPERQVRPDDAVAPGDLYGVSKCFGEALARYVATQHGISAIVLRIGAFLAVADARQGGLANMDAFISRDDLAQLVVRCIDDERLGFAILHALSGNRFNRLDITSARDLVGYAPHDAFTRENPLLRPLPLHDGIAAHDERHGQRSGMRRELRGHRDRSSRRSSIT